MKMRREIMINLLLRCAPHGERAARGDVAGSENEAKASDQSSGHTNTVAGHAHPGTAYTGQVVAGIVDPFIEPRVADVVAVQMSTDWCTLVNPVVGLCIVQN